MKQLIILSLLISNFSIAQNTKMPAYDKNDFRLGLKLPHINHLSLNPDKEFRDDKFGFNGYGIGFEYNYRKERYIETSISLVLTFELPFPAPVDREYNRILYSYYVSLTDNFVKNRFTFGYGINYAVNHRNEFYRNLFLEDISNSDDTYYSNRDLGLTINAYYRIGKTLHLGIIYRPSLLHIDNGIEPIYEHLVSLELA